MDSEKLTDLFKAIISTDNGVTLNHLRFTALEKVLEVNFPKVSEQYHFELQHLVQAYEKQFPGFLPPPNVEKKCDS